MPLLYFVFVLLSGIPWAAKTVVITSVKAERPLSFETIYRVNICNNYSTVIEPPEGFTLQDLILGDSKLFKAERSDNRVILKRLAPDEAKTNLVLILMGEDKKSHSLTFELTGEDTPRISSLQFYVAAQREKNPALESERALCRSELELTLWGQEKRLTETVHDKTLEKLETFRLDGSLSFEKLGVSVALDAVLNSGGKGYVFLTTNASDSGFQIVRLCGIKGGDSYRIVKLFRTEPFQSGVRYIYETTPFVKQKEAKPFAFEFSVYHEEAKVKAKIE